MFHKLCRGKCQRYVLWNPLDLFERDKARIGFQSFFKHNKKPLLETFQEITARRNVIVHNEGRIDRKYVFEVKNTSLSLGQKVGIDEQYLRRSLLVIKDLSPPRLLNSWQPIFTRHHCGAK